MCGWWLKAERKLWEGMRLGGAWIKGEWAGKEPNFGWSFQVGKVPAGEN